MGTVFLQMGRLTNRTRGNKSKEFESLSLTIKVGSKQLSVTLLNSVITLKLIIWVRKKITLDSRGQWNSLNITSENCLFKNNKL